MRFEGKITTDADNVDPDQADADVKMTPQMMANSSLESFDLFEGDLPDDFQELAAQLSADADRLSELYPARPEREIVATAEVVPESAVVGSAWRRLKWVPRVAAAVGLLAGLTLIVGLSSAWRGMLAGKPGEEPTTTAAPLAVAETVNTSRSAPAETASAGRPVSISAEALRLSGEEMEILRHATEGEVVEVDI